MAIHDVIALDLSSLENATATLERSVFAATSLHAAIPEELRDTVRSGIIRNFEVAYEVSWKMMKRWLSANVGPDIVNGVPRREWFRRAAENGLIADVDLWMSFHAARNETSHTYDHGRAAEVATVAVGFAPAARALLSALRARHG